MGFLKFLFFVIAIYYILKLIGRYVMPYFLSIFIRKAQDRMMGNSSNYTSPKKSKKEGEVSVNSSYQKTPKSNKDTIGDYVDFEEVDE